MLQFASSATNVSFCLGTMHSLSCLFWINTWQQWFERKETFHLDLLYFINKWHFLAPSFFSTISSVSSPRTFAMNTPAPCPFFKYLFQISEYGFLFLVLVLLHFH
jgi:hypothetical protein